MTITKTMRDRIAAAAEKAWNDHIEKALVKYCSFTSDPSAVVIHIYDADGLGQGVEPVGPGQEDRRISRFTSLYGTDDNPDDPEIKNADQNAHGSFVVSFRTGKDSGVVARHFPELLWTDDVQLAGCVIGTLFGVTIAVSTDGLEDDENDAFSFLMLSSMRRIADQLSQG